MHPDGDVYVLNGGYEGRTVVGAEGQYANKKRSAGDDRVDQAEVQYPDNQLSASDSGLYEAKCYYAEGKGSGSDNGADEALQASTIRSDS